MEFLRKSAISVACFTLFASLVFFGTALAIRQVVGQPAPLENALDRTNIYSDIVTDFVQSHQDATTIGVPLTIPAIQTAIQEAFPKSVVQPAVNQFISGVYAWAQGKSSTPTFRIDLTSAKTNLANNVGTAVEQQANKLPVCTSSSEISTVAQLVHQNPLAISCIPPRISSATIGNYAKQVVLTSSFLQNPVLTPQSLHLTTGDTIKLPARTPKSTQTIAFPKLYRGLMDSLYASVGLSAICIGSVIWLHRDKVRGIGRVGVTLGWAGFACVADALIAGEIPKWLDANTSKFTDSSGQQVSNILQEAVIRVLAILAKDFRRWLLAYGIIVFVIGVGTWLEIVFLRHKEQKPSTPVVTNGAPVDPNSSI
jgi:hypothetical protein